ncbi:MAG TPA: hypothetical protein VNH11_25255 [Pirellulales bacterium]|nr:hypothetical protein [Pirellulales bacterium]
MISRTDRERELYQSRLKMRRDISAEVTSAKQAAQAEGLKQGLEQGLAEGRASTRRADIQSLQKSLGQSVTPLEQLQTLSWDELESVWARLQADLQMKLTNHA